ncbi:MAG: hypothetical protein B6D41_00850 [Chloroflexi bacterium UTCFX4]|jgi:excisionase family DNA binding protein|nr:MAG: hypothetical protein B6D41_00850 [Chloroflexi bacterium UTCFX4]
MAEWLSVKEAAELAGYHIQHIRLLIRKGEIKAKKIVIVWQVNRASLMAYLKRTEDLGNRRGPKRR